MCLVYDFGSFNFFLYSIVFWELVKYQQSAGDTMSEESYIYQLVNLPHISQTVDDNNEMINILTPILSVDEKNNTLIKTEFDVILQPKVAEIIEIKTEEAISEQDVDSKRYERLQKDIFRKKLARLRETEEQRLERLRKDRLRKKRARQNETPEQRQARLEKDRVRIQKRRALETEDERRRRLEKNRISKRNARLKENSILAC